MARYAIGDVQGCFDSLQALLTHIEFDPKQDELWFAGDLVNRGPKSLDTLRFIKQLGEQEGRSAKVVLGNHDLHLLACYYGDKAAKKKDTFHDILHAADCADLMHWLKQQPLMMFDAQANIVMTHAGLPHIWSLDQALAYNIEVQSILASDELSTFFDNMYGNSPAAWSEKLTGLARLRVITNYFTRMRFMKESGELDFAAKESLDSAPKGFSPWFRFPMQHTATLVFGHWAALSGKTGCGAQFQAIDTGCVWGGKLTALNLETLERFSVKSKETLTPLK